MKINLLVIAYLILPFIVYSKKLTFEEVWRKKVLRVFYCNIFPTKCNTVFVYRYDASLL